MTHDPDEQFAGIGEDEFFEQDLTGVPSEEDRFRLPPGEYEAVVEDVEHYIGKSSGKKSYKWTFLVSSKDRDLTVYLYTSLDPKAAWRLGQVTSALGVGGTGSVVKFSRRQVVGRRVLVELKDEDPYNGMVKSGISVVKPHPKGPKREEAPF